MTHQVSLDSSARADNPQADDLRDDATHQVTPDLAYKRLLIVNVVFYGLPASTYSETQPNSEAATPPVTKENLATRENPLPSGSPHWVLIDAGLPGTTGQIIAAIKARFGADIPPAAIILTHGHFDHVGALEALADHWKVPIYAHELELPYLNGSASYPPPDPSVGGGLMARLSPLYPRGPVDVSSWLHPLPADGSVPEMPGWQWIATPGHSVGHVSLWRESDKTLIVGDAFVTTAQESVYSAITQHTEMHGPPMYYTHNWEQAQASVKLLAALEPEIAVPGHGRAMEGEAMREALHTLARDFEQVAVPHDGHYVIEPVTAEDGSAYAPAK